MKRFVIGIPTSIINENNKKRYQAYSRYEEYLHHFKILTIYLTPLNSSYLLNYVNGVLFVGGDDINPQIYQKKESNEVIDDYQDTFELSLLKKCRLLNKPVFGICRGLQLINVYFKGTLKNIENHQKCEHICQVINENSSNITVNSFHRQCIDELGNDLIAILKSKDDEIIEGISDKKGTIWAVQYHPEMMFDKFFIDNLKNVLNNTLI